MWPSPAVPWQSPASAAPAVSGGRSAARRAISSASRSQAGSPRQRAARSEEHTSELQSRLHLVCRLLLEKKKKNSFVRQQRALSHLYHRHSLSAPLSSTRLYLFHSVKRGIHADASNVGAERDHRSARTRA